MLLARYGWSPAAESRETHGPRSRTSIFNYPWTGPLALASGRRLNATTSSMRHFSTLLDIYRHIRLILGRKEYVNRYHESLHPADWFPPFLIPFLAIL
jgi:hypothetical protein